MLFFVSATEYAILTHLHAFAHIFYCYKDTEEYFQFFLKT